MKNPSDFLSNPDRYRAYARETARNQTSDKNERAIFPTNNRSSINSKSGELDEKHEARGRSSRASRRRHEDAPNPQLDGNAGDDRNHISSVATSTHNNSVDATTPVQPPPAPPPLKSQNEGSGNTTLESGDAPDKPTMINRMKAGSTRFVGHTKDAIFHSWVNVLLIFVPIGIIVQAIGLSPTIVFAMNAIAIIPLAGLLAHATESAASRLGDSLGALLNVTFGNAVELIIFIIALVKNEIRIVQASLLGSILANLLLILGMAFLLGGLRYREQIYNSTVTQMSACLLSLSVMSLLLPTAFHASFNADSVVDANNSVLKVSRGTSVVLLFVYLLYLLFQLKSHAYMYESTPQEIIDEESHPGVLANMLDSSSSSGSSSSSDSSDTDASGSINNAGRRLKRVWKHRKRRKSSASSTVVPSVVSAPSMEECNSHRDPASRSSSLQEEGPRTTTSHDDDEADNEGVGRNRPRVRDFGGLTNDRSGSPATQTRRKKKYCKKCKRHHKRHDHEGRHQDTPNGKLPVRAHETPRVGLADDVEVADSRASPEHDFSPAKRAFNMRQLSSRASFRPALPKMLSQTVFTQPSPHATPATQSAAQSFRSRSSGRGLRRTSSLPDRLDRQNTPIPTTTTTDPIPPYQNHIHPEASDTPSTPSGPSAKPPMSRTAAVVLLLASTALVAVCAEFMVDAIPAMIASTPSVSETFIGLITLPIVGNAAEHVTAVVVATKNKMDLAIGVAVGSSIQIALFVTPLVVLLGWAMERDMGLHFNLFETVALFVAVFVVNFLVLDGRSNWLEGALLCAAYIIIGVGAFFYPAVERQSEVGGGIGGGGEAMA